MYFVLKLKTYTNKTTRCNIAWSVNKVFNNEVAVNLKHKVTY